MRRYLSIAIAALMLALVPLSAASKKNMPKTVQGTVTDTNGKPVAGVVVSDGFQVVVTDSEGKYSFPRRPDASFVSVSLPSEFEVPMRQGHPCFYRKLVDAPSYDFILKRLRKGAEKSFNLFLIADPQCQSTYHARRLEAEGMTDLKAYARKVKGPDYAVTLGDIGYSEGWRNTNYLLPLIKNIMAEEYSGMPIFQTVGNHDFDYDPVKTDEYTPTNPLRLDRYFEAVFGPTNYSWNRGDVHIVSMNNVMFDDIDNPHKYHGDFSAEQVEWLRQDLAQVPEDKFVILCVHIPFEGIYKKYENAKAVMELLAARPYKRIVSGHTHTIKHLDYPNGVHEHVCGAMSGCWWWSKNCADGAPNGYAVYRFEGNQLKSSIYKGQNFSDKYQMRIYYGDAQYGGQYETFKMAHEPGVMLVNIFNWDSTWKTAVYEDGKYMGELEKMPLTGEFNAPYNGGKDWWAIGYNVGVVGRGRNGSNRNNYCSKNYHMFRYRMKNPSAKLKIVATDGSGRSFTETKITTIDDYPALAAPPVYEPSMVW